MQLSNRITLCVALTLCACLQCCAYNYSEISRYKATCSPKDTCSVPRDQDDSDGHNCDCSALCALYDTCCIDSPFLNMSRKYPKTASCLPAGQSDDHVFMVDTCPKSYDGPNAIRTRCEQEPEDWSDPFSRVPVTHPKSRRTYRSIFCCLCNGHDPREAAMWQVTLDCSGMRGSMRDCAEDREFVLSNMMYIRDKGKWGIWAHDQETDWKFRYLDINYKVPEGMKKFVMNCRPNLKSDCHRDWKDDRVRKLCRSYTAAVYFPSATYRNIHCALCNRERELQSMSCHEIRTSAFKGPSMNFGMLLDIDLRHGDRVGEVEIKCGEDQVFDPFSKRCRNIECPIPGYTLKGGKCAQDA